MKLTTKLKIVNWIEKLLGVTKYQPPYNIEQRNIQRIKSEHILSPYEKELLKYKEQEFMDHLKQEMAVNVAKVMQQIGSIRYEIDTDFPSGNVKITATTYVPEKL